MTEQDSFVLCSLASLSENCGEMYELAAKIAIPVHGEFGIPKRIMSLLEKVVLLKQFMGKWSSKLKLTMKIF